MSTSRTQSKRKKRRSGNAPMPMGGAGLMRFFEDSSIGIKVGPISTMILAVALILLVILAHLNVFNWLFTPGGG
ncbi:MAG: preprotein translocase subunit Sec61beta [Candidatus Lokiarchaeota archaeon]|nr:preprotein translocase subunit Sec61beta [Candidatus Lokiarchaeota archaeon]